MPEQPYARYTQDLDRELPALHEDLRNRVLHACDQLEMDGKRFVGEVESQAVRQGIERVDYRIPEAKRGAVAGSEETADAHLRSMHLAVQTLALAVAFGELQERRGKGRGVTAEQVVEDAVKAGEPHKTFKKGGVTYTALEPNIRQGVDIGRPFATEDSASIRQYENLAVNCFAEAAGRAGFGDGEQMARGFIHGARGSIENALGVAGRQAGG